MADPKDTRFKVGVANDTKRGLGNDPALAALRRFGKKQFTRILDIVLTSTTEDLKAIIKDPERTHLSKAVAMTLLKAGNKGDWKSIDGLVERIIGKVANRVDHTTKGGALPGNGPAQVMLYLPANGRTKEEHELALDDGAGF